MKKIVVVDDNEFFLETTKDYLESKSILQCKVFLDANEALQYVLHEEVDAVITDYEMPRLDGFTLAKSILEVFPKMKIVVMSGHDVTTLKERALKAGINEDEVQFCCKANMLELPNLL